MNAMGKENTRKYNGKRNREWKDGRSGKDNGDQDENMQKTNWKKVNEMRKPKTEQKERSRQRVIKEK
jgi:hypothetical protein